jgi:hypothetical protein
MWGIRRSAEGDHLHAARTLRHMGSEHDDVVAAYAAGRPVAELEREYGLTQAEIEYLVAGEPATPTKTGGLHNRGNRVLLGIGIGFVVSTFAGLLGLAEPAALVVWAVTAACAYALVTPRD